ncbi:hypothetical protein [Vibrio sp. DNB22_12_1]
MYYCYLFEAKSIQAYLFKTNKLRDVIAASERLDRLVDSNHNSVLGQVLQSAGLTSDIDDEQENEAELSSALDVHFIRCKGGAFYAYAKSKQPLLMLRSAWSLTLSQLFPSLEYTDAFSEGDDLQATISEAMGKLQADRNLPKLTLPLSTTIMARSERTGQAQILASQFAKEGSGPERNNLVVDVDTERHRQAYHLFGLNQTHSTDVISEGESTVNDADISPLLKRFTPDHLLHLVRYPLNFDTQFPYHGDKSRLTRFEGEAVKNMAMIHIDGNGLGILLRQLKVVMEQFNNNDDTDEAIYRTTFRRFSNILAKATEAAAKIATLKVYNQVAAAEPREDVVMPMRPIVLGGDDLTLFCRADIALEFAETFCEQFKVESEHALKSLFDENHKLVEERNCGHGDQSGKALVSLRDSGIKEFLTASGGILYHKGGHPFAQSHHLVEQLCDHAKALTKTVYGTQSKKVGPAALAFYRVSNASQSELTTLLEQAQSHPISDGRIAELMMSSYFVNMDEHTRLALEKETGNLIEHPRSTNQLKNLAALCKDDGVMPMAKWRQMATLISQRDFAEAEHVYQRALSLCADKKKIQNFSQCIKALFPTQCDMMYDWYWQHGNTLSSFVSDLLVYDHFRAVVTGNELAPKQSQSTPEVSA